LPFLQFLLTLTHVAVGERLGTGDGAADGWRVGREGTEESIAAGCDVSENAFSFIGDNVSAPRTCVGLAVSMIGERIGIGSNFTFVSAKDSKKLSAARLICLDLTLDCDSAWSAKQNAITGSIKRRKWRVGSMVLSLQSLKQTKGAQRRKTDNSSHTNF